MVAPSQNTRQTDRKQPIANTTDYEAAAKEARRNSDRLPSNATAITPNMCALWLTTRDLTVEVVRF